MAKIKMLTIPSVAQDMVEFDLSKLPVGYNTVKSFIQLTSQFKGKHGLPGGSEVKELPPNRGNMDLTPGLVDPLKEETTTYSSTLSWRIPWTEDLAAAIHGVTKNWTQLSD